MLGRGFTRIPVWQRAVCLRSAGFVASSMACVRGIAEPRKSTHRGTSGGIKMDVEAIMHIRQRKSNHKLSF